MRSSEKKNRKVSKKKENEALSANHSKSIKYRLRIQSDKEREEELKEFINASEQIQDYIRRDDLSE